LAEIGVAPKPRDALRVELALDAQPALDEALRDLRAVMVVLPVLSVLGVHFDVVAVDSCFLEVCAFENAIKIGHGLDLLQF
jgi:hypothetical protein